MVSTKIITMRNDITVITVKCRVFFIALFITTAIRNNVSSKRIVETDHHSPFPHLTAQHTVKIIGVIMII